MWEADTKEKLVRDWPAILAAFLMVLIAGFCGGVIASIIVLFCL